MDLKLAAVVMGMNWGMTVSAIRFVQGDVWKGFALHLKPVNARRGTRILKQAAFQIVPSNDNFHLIGFK